MNEYTPWIEKGMTELEYFKYRYLEMSKENDRLERQNEIMKEALTSIASLHRSKHDTEEYWMKLKKEGLACVLATDTKIARNALKEITGME